MWDGPARSSVSTPTMPTESSPTTRPPSSAARSRRRTSMSLALARAVVAAHQLVGEIERGRGVQDAGLVRLDDEVESFLLGDLPDDLPHPPEDRLGDLPLLLGEFPLELRREVGVPHHLLVELLQPLAQGGFVHGQPLLLELLLLRPHGLLLLVELGLALFEPRLQAGLRGF